MIVVIVALENELAKGTLPQGIEIIHCGVGKVNAALAASQVILQRQPTLVVNYGTAGQVRPGVDGLVEVARVIQRDMLAMPLAARGQTPFDSDQLAALESGHPGIVCATGDSFVTTADAWLADQGVDVVDMELFAIASACRRHAVPWRAFKYVSDSADGNAARDWTERVRHGEQLFLGQLELMRR